MKNFKSVSRRVIEDSNRIIKMIINKHLSNASTIVEESVIKR